MYKIYKYTNKINGKVYIGQTSKTLEERAQSNGSNYKECRKFYAAIQKYGWESFEAEILIDGLSLEEANNKEEEYIRLYNSTGENGYNLALGGNNTEMSAESKSIISEKAKLRYRDPSQNPMYGKKHSSESIQLMSQIKSGTSNPMYGSRWNANQRSAVRHGWTYEWTVERRAKQSSRSKILANKWSRHVLCVEDNRIFETITDAANEYGVSKGTLSNHLHGRQKTCAGKHFQFIDQ